MEIPEITILLIATLITTVSIGVFLILMELNYLRGKIRIIKQRQEQNHSEVMYLLKMLSATSLSALKENCTAQERYEDAIRLNEILKKIIKIDSNQKSNEENIIDSCSCLTGRLQNRKCVSDRISSKESYRNNRYDIRSS